jgi:hypothetical protein
MLRFGQRDWRVPESGIVDFLWTPRRMALKLGLGAYVYLRWCMHHEHLRRRTLPRQQIVAPAKTLELDSLLLNRDWVPLSAPMNRTNSNRRQYLVGAGPDRIQGEGAR